MATIVPFLKSATRKARMIENLTETHRTMARMMSRPAPGGIDPTPDYSEALELPDLGGSEEREIGFDRDWKD